MKTLLSWLGRYDDLHKPHPYTNSDGFYHKNKTRKGKDKEKDVVSPYHLKKSVYDFISIRYLTRAHRYANRIRNFNLQPKVKNLKYAKKQNEKKR